MDRENRAREGDEERREPLQMTMLVRMFFAIDAEPLENNGDAKVSAVSSRRRGPQTSGNRHCSLIILMIADL